MVIAIISLSVLCIILAVFGLMTTARLNTQKRQTADISQRLAVAEAERSSVMARLDTAIESDTVAKTEIARLQERLALSDREISRLNTAIAQSAEQQEKMLKQSEANFKVLANDIMQQHSTAFRRQNEERLIEILTPLKENIDKFRHDVNECYSTEARERFSLQDRIKELIEANAAIGREAKELATALKGNSKMQGDWGEMVLETILENSGLRKGEEFEVQMQSDETGTALRDDRGHGLRPDVVVKYPGPDGGVMIIDSKVSLTAFVDYVNAEDDAERERLGKLHLASIVKHINELSEKRYQDYIGSGRLDFVMMFVPNEAAYAAALNLDHTLWQKAYDKRVLLVSPTQLIGSLRLIKQLWNQDRQTRNAMEIAERSGMMYDKFVGFVADMEKIEKSLGNAQSAYTEAMKKLRDGRGNLISRAEKLRELGVKNSKRLPDSEE